MKYLVSKMPIWIIIAATLLSYSTIFTNGFVWDDFDLIVNWPEIRSWQNIPKFLVEATNPNYPDTYRPVRYIFSILMYQLSGTNPLGYHAATILLHITATLLIYSLLKKLTADRRIPFVTALLFGIHPIHTEAVTWISSGMDMIGVVFMLAALRLGIQENKRFIWFSLICATLAHFTLEITVVLPALLMLLVFVKNKTRTHSATLSSLFPYLLLSGLYLYIRWRVVGIQEVFGHVDGRIDRTFLLMMHALVAYVHTFFIPINLTVNHMLATGVPSFMIEIGDAFPTTLSYIRSITLFTPRVIIGALLSMTSIVGCFVFYRTAPLISFALGWIIITLLPVMNIIPGHTLMAERYLYIPSMGFCLLMAVFYTRLLDRTKHPLAQKIIPIGLLCLSISYMSLTILRNNEWKNGVTLWKSATERNPYSYIAFTALGKQYVAHKEYDKAIDAYLHVLQFFPEQKMVVGYLTELYIQAKRYTDAIALITSVTLLRPQEAEIWIKLGDVYRLIPDHVNARQSYLKAQALDPDNPLVVSRLSQ